MEQRRHRRPPRSTLWAPDSGSKSARTPSFSQESHHTQACPTSCGFTGNLRNFSSATSVLSEPRPIRALVAFDAHLLWYISWFDVVSLPHVPQYRAALKGAGFHPNGYLCSENCHRGLMMCPKAANGTYLVIAGPDA